MDATPASVGVDRPVTIAVVAMGGQGGGVLADWLRSAGEASGFVAQVTSVPGVAQRTGATIYYIEMIAKRASGRAPVLALMPVPGDVDLVIASEWMEAGRAILRGIVTPERTTLVASSHRALAVAEKEVPGDGTADPEAVHAAAGVTAKRQIVADFARIAERHGSVVSAALLGAVAASAVLPLPRRAFEDAIRAGGVGVETSLKAFAAGFDEAERGALPTSLAEGKSLPDVPETVGEAQLDALLLRLRTAFPPRAQRMIYAGLRHVVDFQDPAYGAEYLDRLAPIAALDATSGGDARGAALTNEVARQLARAMAYDDVIRVADLKTRSSRTARVQREIALDASRQVLHTTEYFHPRVEEICATLPAWLGRAIEERPRVARLVDRLFGHGRRVRTDTVLGYLQLHLLAGRKPKRRQTLRHGREIRHIEAWLARVTGAAAHNYALAVELAKTRRLIKGYSDTMSRGQSKYDRVMQAAEQVAGRSDASDWVRRLRTAALLDEAGLALDGAIKTLASLDDVPQGSEKAAAT